MPLSFVGYKRKNFSIGVQRIFSDALIVYLFACKEIIYKNFLTCFHKALFLLLNQFRSRFVLTLPTMSWYQMHFETEAGKPRYDPFVPSKR